MEFREEKIERMLKILFLIFLLTFKLKSENIITQDELDVTTFSPKEGEIQYVGSFYCNGGMYSIILTKIQQTSGSVVVDFTRRTYMDDGSKRNFGATDTWVWDPKEQTSKQENGGLWLNTLYFSFEIGSHTRNTYINWEGWEFTGTGWKYIGGGVSIDTNNFTVAEPEGCW